MFAFVRRLLSADAENAVLKQAVIDRDAEIAFWKRQAEEAHNRFLVEVKSNRKREDQLSAQVRSLSGVVGSLPEREYADAALQSPDRISPEADQPSLFDAGDRDPRVEHIVEQFVENAEAQNLKYDNAAKELLRKIVTDNLDFYMN